MTLFGYIAVFAAACLATAGLTAIVLKMATRLNVIDFPNQRSSHEIPTPRGGGLAIVVVLFASSVLIALRFNDHQFLWLAALIALLGWLGWHDDRNDLPVTSRLSIQLIVAVIAVTIFGRLTSLDLGNWQMPLSILAWPVSVLFVLWMINLYNFMDGIDGIAGVEALIGGLTLASWFYISGQYSWSIIGLIIAGASLGFLFYNWQPASIFLGDTGSVTLGGVFATISLAGVYQAGFPLSAVVLLFGVFIFDATITLIKRLLRGENLTVAHKSHFYQIAVARGYQHRQVSLVLLGLDIILATLATLVFLGVQPILLWEVAGLLLLGGAASIATRKIEK